MWEELKKKGIKVKHFRDKNKQLIATMVYSLGREDNVYYGFSSVSKKDAGNKAKGRHIAYARFLSLVSKEEVAPKKYNKGCAFTKQTGIYVYRQGEMSATLFKAFFNQYYKKMRSSDGRL